MKIHIVPHNPTWSASYQKAKTSLEEILQDIPILSIQHVGSTSIPGLLAKPVLDIDIIIPRTPDSLLSRTRAALVEAGYYDCGEMNGRYGFRQPGFGQKDPATGEETGGEIRRNTYIMIEGSTALRNHLDIKRVLLEDRELRDEYGAFKLRLAEREFWDMGGYSGAKNGILCRILQRAGWTEEELAEVRAVNTEATDVAATAVVPNQ